MVSKQQKKMRIGLGRQWSVIPRREDLWFNLNGVMLERLCPGWRVSYSETGTLLPISICRKRLKRTVARMLPESSTWGPEVA